MADLKSQLMKLSSRELESLVSDVLKSHSQRITAELSKLDQQLADCNTPDKEDAVYGEIDELQSEASDWAGVCIGL